MNLSASIPREMQASSQSVWFLVGQISRTPGNLDSVCVPITTPFVVGRRHEASLCLPFRTVSSNHAELLITDQGVLLRDLNSTNGTFVNGEKLEGEVLLKPDDLIQFADVAMRLRQQGAASEVNTLAEDVCDQALALVQFDKLLNERAVTPYYQPIVDLNTHVAIGYEVLGRSRLLGVETPGAMFRAAAKLNLEVQLSMMLRWEGIRQSTSFASVHHLFVNTHPQEMGAPDFFASLHAVRDAHPSLPLTVEIHEGAVTDLAAMTRIRDELAALDISLAYDDFGAGQARLIELVEAKPDILKFDISLIRDLDKGSAQHQQLVGSLVKIALDLGVQPLAEGVETASQSEICRQLGFTLGQGYFYGKPAPVIMDSHDLPAMPSAGDDDPPIG